MQSRHPLELVEHFQIEQRFPEYCENISYAVTDNYDRWDIPICRQSNSGGAIAKAYGNPAVPRWGWEEPADFCYTELGHVGFDFCGRRLSWAWPRHCSSFDAARQNRLGLEGGMKFQMVAIDMSDSPNGSNSKRFDYSAAAELFPSRTCVGRRPMSGYQRFVRAAEAIQYAIEVLPREMLAGTYLEIDEARYDCHAIRFLYDSTEYPLTRRSLGSDVHPHAPKNRRFAAD